MHFLAQNIPTPCGNISSTKRCFDPLDSRSNISKRVRDDAIDRAGAQGSGIVRPQIVNCNLTHEIHMNIVRLFVRFVAQTGLNEDIHLVSVAWRISCRAFAYAFERSVIDFSSSLHSLKSIIIGSISLAIDASADFNSSFTVSAAAWGHFFFCELTRRSNAESVDYKLSTRGYDRSNDNCRQLIRMKNLIARSIDWELHAPSVVGVFLGFLERIRFAESICDYCRGRGGNAAGYMEIATPYIETMSYRFLFLGVDEVVIAVSCLILCHRLPTKRERSGLILEEMKSNLNIATDEVRKHGVPKCLRAVIEDEKSLEEAVELICSADLCASLILFAAGFFPCKVEKNAGEVLHQIENSIEDFHDIID